MEDNFKITAIVMETFLFVKVHIAVALNTNEIDGYITFQKWKKQWTKSDFIGNLTTAKL